MFVFLRAIASLFHLLRLAARPAVTEEPVRVRAPQGPKSAPAVPTVPREARELLDGAQPPTREEIELYVPRAFHDLGPEWTFTRGKVLMAIEVRRESLGETDGYFDGPTEWTVYKGVYGYYDHRHELQAHDMGETRNDRDVRPGRSFIILFNRRSPREHHLFTFVRQQQPAKPAG